MNYNKLIDINKELYNRSKIEKKYSQDYWNLIKIPLNAAKLKKKYNINFNGEIVPTNEDMIERLFKAGFEMLLNSGIYIADTSTVIKYTEDEIYESIKKNRKKLILGSGKDSIIVNKRTIADKCNPIIQGGPLGSLISKNMFIPIHMSYIKEKEVDCITSGTLTFPIQHKLSMYKNKNDIFYDLETKLIKHIINICNRPGIFIDRGKDFLYKKENIISNISNIYTSKYLYSYKLLQQNDLNINLNNISIISYCDKNDYMLINSQMPIYGGCINGIEETAIVNVASHLNTFMMSNASYHLDGPVHIRWKSTSTRETLTISSWTSAAISNHTNFISGNQYYPCSGPCTEMCFLELAAQSIADSASGREILSGVARENIIDKTTGIEARMIGEVSKAASGVDIQTINKILNLLISSYEKNYSKAPSGKTFQKCYDLKTITPNKEYLSIYENSKKILESFGLTF